MPDGHLKAWANELDDFLRAFSGAFLFGVPLLFTMEMWWIGTYIEPWKALLFLLRLDRVRRTGDVYYVPIQVANHGGATMANLRVQVTLTLDQGERESGEFIIDFLAGSESAQATVAFRHHPSRGTLTDQVSYVEP